jgi:hypothetical protein
MRYVMRCRTQTALDKLHKLRQWVKRFKWIGDTLQKVFAPTLEKALTFLDDKLLPATSNRSKEAIVVIARCKRACIAFAVKSV